MRTRNESKGTTTPPLCGTPPRRGIWRIPRRFVQFPSLELNLTHKHKMAKICVYLAVHRGRRPRHPVRENSAPTHKMQEYIAGATKKNGEVGSNSRDIGDAVPYISPLCALFAVFFSVGQVKPLLGEARGTVSLHPLKGEGDRRGGGGVAPFAMFRPFFLSTPQKKITPRNNCNKSRKIFRKMQNRY